jgi:hypothetical protein
MGSLSKGVAARASGRLSKSGGGSLTKGSKKGIANAAANRLSGGAKSTATRYSVQSNSTGNYATPSVPAATAGDINTYLAGDSGYQDQLSALAKALSDFQADVTRRKGSLDTDYGLSKKALGDQRTKDLSDLESDYASRGILRSGVYGKAVGDYETEYGQRVSDLDRRQQDALQQLLTEQSNYSQQNTLEQQRAREEAAARRAATYGV